MAAQRLSATIVTYFPDPAEVESAVRSLQAAIAHARDRALISDATLFLVDNGPARPDSAAKRAARVFTGRVEVIEGHGNIGYGRANNLVLPRLDSDVHLVMNPDVELEPDTLTAALAAMEANPGIGVAAPCVHGSDGRREYLCKRYPSVWVLFLRGFAPAFLRRRFNAALDAYEMRDLPESAQANVPLASGCFMLVRTALFARLGGFDPRFFMYFEDYDLSLRAGRESAVAYVPEARIVHHGGDASAKGLRHILWFIRSAWRFFANHGWRLK